MLTWKLRITVLWIIYAICYPLAMILLMFEPGVIRHLMAGEWLGRDAHSAGLQIARAATWLIPLGMACLTLFLKDAVSRWTNRVVGTLFAVQGILHLFGLMAGGTFGGAEFIDLVMSLVALLLAWQAWKWPRPTQLTPPLQREETTLH